MVKRLRRRPLTAETGVRFPYGSPMTYRRTKQRFFRNAALFFAFVIRQKHIVIAVKFDYCEGMIRISDMERQIRKNKKTKKHPAYCDGVTPCIYAGYYNLYRCGSVHREATAAAHGSDRSMPGRAQLLLRSDTDARSSRRWCKQRG